MTGRLSSGNKNLDTILNGGLLLNAINLIVGIPGSGKTILSQQFAFHNATRERPALFLSTLSEPLDKIIRYADSLEFFDRQAVRDGVFRYEDVGQSLGEGGLDGVVMTIDGLLKDLNPSIVVIDSFRAFHALAGSAGAFRQFLYTLTRRLAVTQTTSVWNAPYSRADAIVEAEFAVADAIIALDIKLVAEREQRVLQVMKLRGSGFLSGEHVYRIDSTGLNVYPRLADIKSLTPYELSSVRTGSGVEALDQLLGDNGYWAGAATLIAGPTGIGKTLMGLHFLHQGASVDEPGILATFQENVTQLSRIVTSFGWSMDNPNVTYLSRGLVDLNIDEWVYELLGLIEKNHARRVVIDSLSDLMVAARDDVRFREWIASLIQRCTRTGVSLMLLVEVADLFQLRRVSEDSISHLSDNVVLLQYVQEGSQLSRAVTVLKTRAQAHRPAVHRYEITPKGFVLGEPISLTR